MEGESARWMMDVGRREVLRWGGETVLELKLVFAESRHLALIHLRLRVICFGCSLVLISRRSPQTPNNTPEAMPRVTAKPRRKLKM